MSNLHHEEQWGHNSSQCLVHWAMRRHEARSIRVLPRSQNLCLLVYRNKRLCSCHKYLPPPKPHTGLTTFDFPPGVPRGGLRRLGRLSQTGRRRIDFSPYSRYLCWLHQLYYLCKLHKLYYLSRLHQLTICTGCTSCTISASCTSCTTCAGCTCCTCCAVLHQCTGNASCEV